MTHTIQSFIPKSISDNPLVTEPMAMTITEARLCVWAINSLSHDTNPKYRSATWIASSPRGEVDTLFFRIPLERVTPKSNAGYNFEQVRQACKGLLSKIVTLSDKENDYNATSIFSNIHCRQDKQVITGNFSPVAMPELLKLTHQEDFNFQFLFRLKSPYAHRLFWMLHYHQAQFEVSIEDLRTILFASPDAKGYSLFGDFKRSILEPAVQELRSLDWDINYTELKRGNRVIGLSFIVPGVPVTPLDA